MFVLDEGYSNHLTMFVLDEGYSNHLTMFVLDEGYSNQFKNVWEQVNQKASTE
jgi:hypothetical protein